MQEIVNISTVKGKKMIDMIDMIKRQARGIAIAPKQLVELYVRTFVRSLCGVQSTKRYHTFESFYRILETVNVKFL